jgi:ABC-type uncharacterized transport system
LFLSACQNQSAEQSQKPAIGVMTALPLFWGEGDAKLIVQGSDQRAVILKRLGEDRKVLPVDTLSKVSLEKISLLILAQPRLLSGEEIIQLDDWTRRGGKLILFADPILSWPSQLPLGDARRAPLNSLLDPLFNHWGLSLSAKLPVTGAIEKQMIFGRVAALVTSGIWRNGNARCTLAAEGIIAECVFGQGKAILVADTDILNQLLWAESGIANDRAIMGLIERIESNAQKETVAE